MRRNANRLAGSGTRKEIEQELDPESQEKAWGRVVSCRADGWENHRLNMTKKPEKPHIYLARHVSDPSFFESLMALYKRLTGKDPTAEEIEKARQKHAAFLATSHANKV
jgi:hypothetical protein